jgi:hypothetical protein
MEVAEAVNRPFPRFSYREYLESWNIINIPFRIRSEDELEDQHEGQQDKPRQEGQGQQQQQ